LIGGVLIGLSAAGLLLFHGRIAGISGILGGALIGDDDRSWRWAFLIGLPLGAAITAAVQGEVAVDVRGSALLLIAGGLFVGVGTQLGSGCTSGHGVCGLGRRSPRSLVATATFMGVAGLVVYLLRAVGVSS
jgi:uncharacterized membrane protein YedE/YeeE